MTLKKLTAKTKAPGRETARRSSRIATERAAYASDFATYVQSIEQKREIPKTRVLKLHAAFARRRSQPSLSDAQLFRALKLSGVRSRQVDLLRGDDGFVASKSSQRQRVTVYTFPKISARAASRSEIKRKSEAFNPRPTHFDFKDLFLVGVVLIACIGGPLVAMSDLVRLRY